MCVHCRGGMNDALIENGMVLPQPYDRECFGESDSDEYIYHCEYCDCERSDGEMSDVDGMCSDCYAEALKKLRRYAEAQEDNAVVEVFNYLTSNL
jgi:hypothetical protein